MKAERQPDFLGKHKGWEMLNPLPVPEESDITKTTTHSRVLPEVPSSEHQPCYQAAHLTASEATRSYIRYGIFFIHSRNGAEVLLGEV